jgi:hypothetical protein
MYLFKLEEITSELLLHTKKIPMKEQFWITFDPYVYQVEKAIEKPYGAVTDGFSTYAEAADEAYKRTEERERERREMRECYGEPNG